MITVMRHGNDITTRHPATGQPTRMIDVTFVEYGRPGGDETMSHSSELLSRETGRPSGLQQMRFHTQPVLFEEIGAYAIGREFHNLHINRGLFSMPQMKQQVGRPPQMIEGQPTYFKTWIDDVVQPDKDKRMPNEILAQVAPHLFNAALVGRAQVEVNNQVGFMSPADFEEPPATT